MEKTKKFEGNTLYYEIMHGSKGTFVLLEGIKNTKLMRYIISFYSKKDYTILLPKLPIRSQNTTLTILANQLNAIIDEENLENITFIGIEEGCNIIARHIMQNTERAKQIIFIRPRGSSLQWSDQMQLKKYRLLRALAKMGLWYSSEIPQYDFMISSLTDERNFLLLTKETLLLLHKDMFVPTEKLKKFLSLNHHLKMSFLSTKRLDKERPYEIINAINMFSLEKKTFSPTKKK